MLFKAIAIGETLMQQGREIELNSAEIKDKRMFKLLSQLIKTYGKALQGSWYGEKSPSTEIRR